MLAASPESVPNFTLNSSRDGAELPDLNTPYLM